MKFDTFTIALLTLRSDAPKLSEQEENALQDAHMAYLAKLHEEGHLLAAGPLLGPADRELRGLSILKLPPEETLRLKEKDPAVQAGRYAIKVLPWIVPSGAVTFSSTRFPHSMAEASGA